MPEIRTEDGRYLFAVQGDGNAVVYEHGVPVWDRWSWEARHQVTLPPAPHPAIPPAPAAPIPAVGAGRVIRITSDSDDVVNRMYSYWPSAWILEGAAYVFVGNRSVFPLFFRVELATGHVDRLGPLVSYGGEAEGWYWDHEGWVYLCDGPRLRRVHPFTGQDRIVVDITDTHPGCRLWQSHSSDDGLTHSATVQRIVNDGPYLNLGTLVVRRGQQEYFPAQGALDESALTSDGAFLIIKEDDANRIITLDTRETRLLRNDDGAVGHSDCGDGFVVGEDDQHGACVYWDLRQPLTPERRRELFRTWGMGHLSVKGGRCLVSDAEHISLVGLDGSGVTPIIAHGMTGEGYDFQVMGNLDPTGRVACYVSNAAGRFDAYLLLL